MQRVCGPLLSGQAEACLLRGRSNPGNCTDELHQQGEPELARSLPKLHATCALPKVLPSLRAHEPLSCRARDPSGPGRLMCVSWETHSKCLILNLFLAEALRQGKQEANLGNYSLGPRETGPSIYEPAHTDIHDRTQRQERKQHRRTAVTH